VLIDDSQIWLLIGVIVGAVAVLVMLGVVVNAYITSRRLANVLSDLEEILHADFKELENKIDIALTRIRIAETRGNRE
jgi:hypothetical protein